MAEKNVRTGTALFSVLIAACVSFGGVCCVTTAFKLSADLSLILLFCIGFAAVTTYLMWGSRNGAVLFGLALAGVLALIYLVRPAWSSLKAVCYRLAYTYDTAYGFGLTDGWEPPAADVSFLPGLCVFAGFVVLAQVWTIVRRHNSVLAVICALLPLITCLVVTDTVPAAWAIFLLLTPLVLLILTQTVRRRDERDGNRLTALLLVPCCLLNLLLLRAVPREDYKVNTGSVSQILSDWFWELPFMPEKPGNITIVPVPSVLPNVEVNLDEIGRNFQSDLPVMYVEAEISGPLYLRGQAYDVYTGSRWQVRKDLEGSKLGWPTKNMQAMQTVNVNVQAMGMRSIRFFPYYYERENWLEDYENGRLHALGQNVYVIKQAQPVPGQSLAEESRLTDALYDHYTEIPAYTNQQAQILLSGIELDDDLSVEDKAAAIADYVRQSATYDLMTDRMPEEKQDFAIWFLEEGTTGYCVHFATAATILLRAAGIPCRYVTGYLLYAMAGESVKVSEKQAHA